MEDLYLANLDEYINDEKKVVSYKWLSLTLNVPANTAKQMLYHFVQQHQTSSSVDYDLHITYLVSGLFFNKDTKEDVHKVCIVTDAEFATLKSRSSKIFSAHIYSVQRANLKDFNLIYSANYDKVKEDLFQVSQYSHIKCPSAQRKFADNEASLDKKNIIEKSASKLSSLKQEIPTSDSVAEIKQEPKEKPTKPPPKAGAIASLFANQAKKGVTAKKSLTVQAPKPPSKKGGLISAFLAKAPARPPANPSSDVGKVEIKKEGDTKVDVPVKKEAEVVEESPLPPKGEESVTSNKVGKGTKKQKPAKLATKRLGSPPKSSRNTSKRRRIMALDSDSSSQESEEEDQEEEHEESPLPPPVSASIDSDDEDIIPCTPQLKPSINVLDSAKMRRRKLVDKTFMDDQGFFVTKKEYELVSDDSDAENPLPPKKESPSSKENTSPRNTSPSKSPKKTCPLRRSPRKASQKKPSPKKESPKKRKLSPMKKKQSSIMSFFKKK